MRLNLGCGSQVPENWINVDYSFGARFVKFPFFRRLNKRLRIFNLDWNDDIYTHNLKKKFPWENNTVDVIYCSHTLEHFSREEGLFFIKECHRVLKKNGIFRIVVPDLSNIVEKYLNGELRADYFIEELGVLYRNSRSLIKNQLAPFVQFPHKCMYDKNTLLTILRQNGFDADGKKAFKSDIDGIENIELESRTQHAIIIEGKKVKSK